MAVNIVKKGEDGEKDEVTYYSRVWIFPEGKFSGAYMATEIETSHFCYVGIKIGDGDNSFYFDLDYENQEQYDESVAAIDLVIAEFEAAKTKMAEHRALWVAGEDERQKELQKWKKKNHMD